jgi:hypothetical protein
VTLVSDLDSAIIGGGDKLGLRGELRKFTNLRKALRELLGTWRIGE